MAFKFDFLNSKENKTHHEKDVKEYKEPRQTKESKPLTAEEIRGIVSREVNNAAAKNQVIGYFDSIAASSTRTEAMLTELKDEIESSLAGIRDAALNSDNSEKLRQIDESVRRVVELTGNLEHIDESVRRVAEMTGSIEEMDRSVKQVAEAAEHFEDMGQSIKRVEAMGESLEHIDESARNAAMASESLEAAIHKDNLIMYKTIKEEMEELKKNSRNSSSALRSGLIVSVIFNAITVVILAVMWILYFL